MITGFIPSHLIRYIMAEDCNIWQTDPCGRKGICWDYKANSMAKSIAIFGFVVTGEERLGTEHARGKGDGEEKSREVGNGRERLEGNGRVEGSKRMKGKRGKYWKERLEGKKNL